MPEYLKMAQKTAKRFKKYIFIDLNFSLASSDKLITVLYTTYNGMSQTTIVPLFFLAMI